MDDKQLINNIKDLDKLQRIKMRLVNNEIYEIITNNIIDDNKIEHLFDDILDLYYWFGPDVDHIFEELYNYYKNINNKITKDYQGFYLELKKDNTN